MTLSLFHLLFTKDFSSHIFFAYFFSYSRRRPRVLTKCKFIRVCDTSICEDREVCYKKRASQSLRRCVLEQCHVCQRVRQEATPTRKKRACPVAKEACRAEDRTVCDEVVVTQTCSTTQEPVLVCDEILQVPIV